MVPQCLNPKTGVAVMLGPQCCCEDRRFNDEIRGGIALPLVNCQPPAVGIGSGPPHRGKAHTEMQ